MGLSSERRRLASHVATRVLLVFATSSMHAYAADPLGDTSPRGRANEATSDATRGSGSQDDETKEPAPSPDQGLALLLGGLAFGSLATGAVYGVLAWQNHEDFVANPTTNTANRGQFDAFVADICFVGAASFAVVAAALFARPDPESSVHTEPIPKATPRVSIAPFASPHGGGAGAIFRY